MEYADRKKWEDRKDDETAVKGNLISDRTHQEEAGAGISSWDRSDARAGAGADYRLQLSIAADNEPAILCRIATDASTRAWEHLPGRSAAHPQWQPERTGAGSWRRREWRIWCCEGEGASASFCGRDAGKDLRFGRRGRRVRGGRRDKHSTPPWRPPPANQLFFLLSPFSSAPRPQHRICALQSPSSRPLFTLARPAAVPQSWTYLPS